MNLLSSFFVNHYDIIVFTSISLLLIIIFFEKQKRLLKQYESCKASQEDLWKDMEELIFTHQGLETQLHYAKLEYAELKENIQNLKR